MKIQNTNNTQRVKGRLALSSAAVTSAALFSVTDLLRHFTWSALRHQSKSVSESGMMSLPDNVLMPSTHSAPLCYFNIGQTSEPQYQLFQMWIALESNSGKM